MTAYVAGTGETVYGGRYAVPPGQTVMLNALSGMSDGTWLKVNASGNKYSDAWAPSDYRAIGPGTNGTPDALIRCWSGFGWDDEQCRLLLWGGGHANTWSNSMYMWEASTRNWKLGFHDTRIAANGVDTFDGALNSPMSSHTYGNNIWLPVSKRFATFGGAAQPGGGQMRVRDAAGNELRAARCYTCDLSQIGIGKVGGITGSNMQTGTTAGVNLTGANAWQLRDWDLTSVALSSRIGYAVNGWAQAETEGGKDVIYVSSGLGTGGTSLGMLKVVINDINNPATDTVSDIGRFWTNFSADSGGAYDTTRLLAFTPTRRSDYLFEGWNGNTPGGSNNNYRVPDSAVTGAGKAALLTVYASGKATGTCYDKVRNKFVVWNYGGALFYITPPSNLANLETSGWVVDQVGSDALSPRPKTIAEYTGGTIETGVHGKFRYSKRLDCYIVLTHVADGEIWIYRPAGWTPGGA
jgi:hypothetical protein